MPLVIGDSEITGIDAHTHLGRRQVALGHGWTEFLGQDLVKNLDEVGLDRAVAFPLGGLPPNLRADVPAPGFQTYPAHPRPWRSLPGRTPAPLHPPPGPH